MKELERMKWISVKDKKPPKEGILVYGNCGMMHVPDWDSGEYVHTECCYPESKSHFGGEIIEFTHWMPLPKSPLELEEIEQCRDCKYNIHADDMDRCCSSIDEERLWCDKHKYI